MKITDRKKKYITQNEAAEILGLSIGSVTNAIGRLDKQGVPDLIGVRPALLLVGDDGKTYSGDGLTLSRDLITVESLNRFIELRGKGTKARPRRGNKIRAFAIDGKRSKILGMKAEKVFISEAMALSALGVKSGVLRSRIKTGNEIAPGICVEKL